MRALLVLAIALSLSAQDKEMALGEHVASDIRKRTTPVEGRAQEYVYGLGKRLAPAGSHWQFEVVADDLGGPTYEPVWVPGYVFVPARLLLMTGSEAELAGMLAHALAHSMAHTADRRDGRIVYFGGDAAPPGLEIEADRRAIETVAAAGYNPRALIDYIARVQPAQESGAIHRPSRDERIAAMEEALARTPLRAEWTESTAAFVAAQEQVRRLLARSPARRPSLFRRDR